MTGYMSNGLTSLFSQIPLDIGETAIAILIIVIVIGILVYKFVISDSGRY